MEKPCCGKCVRTVKGEPYDYDVLCSDKECECHLPKEETEADRLMVRGLTAMGERKQPPAPEKKWEARLKEEFYDGDIGEYGSEGLVDKSENGERLIAFIRQILEEKAVEGERLKVKHETHLDHKTWCGFCGRNAAISEFAAILRR